MNASFDRQRAEIVLGTYPRCFLCNKNAEELHHCLGRGYKYGFRGNESIIMSSLYNCAPLCRECHSRGDLSYQNTIKKLLTLAAFHYSMAVREGKIEHDENDMAFRTAFRRFYLLTKLKDEVAH